MSQAKQPTREELMKIVGKPFNELSSIERGHKLDMLFGQMQQLQSTMQQIRKVIIDNDTKQSCDVSVLKKYLVAYCGCDLSTYPELLEIEVDARRGLVKAEADALVENKDWIRVSYCGFDESGEKAKGTEGQSEIYLGAKQFIEDFEAACIGMKCGESKEAVPCTFPADYGVKEYAGKVINFNITVVAHKKPIVSTPV